MRRNTEVELRTQREDRRVLWSISFRLTYWEAIEVSLEGIPWLFTCSYFCYLDLDFLQKDLRSFIKKRHVCSKTQKIEMKQQDPCPPTQSCLSIHLPSLLWLQHRGSTCTLCSPQHCFLGFSKYVMLCVEYIFVKRKKKLKKTGQKK